jgi:hypothetical protein
MSPIDQLGLRAMVLADACLGAITVAFRARARTFQTR